ncbi:MAG: imidazoleglycerol-phosphate dehydratase HisB [Candidatus Omnitrophica bacterium CG07_land_8_20_14_0_80_42_15]|uniref:Imidazoleglycerol-phosphate dehydratase n=1 Tax=Candidatus Aquitaenariimonas noxiae TaxID=1974741 RepID=A0A2J0L705_9BACT|nr:MAG: imidazoleglycerol-phosphate dehydratase HisB [Candidatus Omnitrophica bacterium CG07_land_8_20_14_0_80_42_15]
MKRTAQIKRKTTETDIALYLNIDGTGKSKVSTGIAFLDHMLTLFAKHGLFDLEIKAKGDLGVDIHHTNEDIGISLGEAFKKVLKDKKGIRRFGVGYVVMEEALVRVVLDLSGRYSLNFVEMVKLGETKGYNLRDMKHFLEAFAREAGVNLSIGIKSGSDTHHVLEALFKALGRALDEATTLDPRIKGVPSTKGKL